MSAKLVAPIVFMIILAVFDAVFIGSLPFGLHRLHLVPLALIFAVLLSNLRFAGWLALAAGLTLELFSFRFFGAYLIIFWLVLALVDFLLEKVMTNRSIYSVAIIVAGVVIVCDGLSLFYDYMAGTTLRTWPALLANFGLSLAANIVLGAIIFYTSSLITQRLRPVFLLSKRNV